MKGFQLGKIKRMFLGTVLCTALGIVCDVHAYEVPIGIPEPFVDPDVQMSQRPANWDQEISGYYYVDYENGTDSVHAYGYPGAPRRTIPRPIPAGSYIEIKGTYSYAQGGVIWIDGNGTASSPIWIVSSPDQQGVFVSETASVPTIVRGSYIYIDGLHWRSPLWVGSSTNDRKVDHVLIRNCILDGQKQSATGLVVIGNSYSSDASHVIIYNNQVHNWGDINSDYDEDAGGISVAQYSSYVWVLNNVCHDSSSQGIFVGAQYGSALDETHHVYIGGNTVYHTRQGCIATKVCSHIVMSQNHVYDAIPRITSDGESRAKGLSTQYGAQDIWMIYNVIHDAEYGIKVPSSSDYAEELDL